MLLDCFFLATETERIKIISFNSQLTTKIQNTKPAIEASMTDTICGVD